MNTEYINMLRGKFSADQFALLDEVRDAAGHQANRSCDVMAFGLWPSRGHELHGIEVKSGRGDWLKEMKNPMKQESIFKYCDRFWLLATNEKVVLNQTEIPKNWGYLLAKGDRIFTKKEAPTLAPKQFSKSFFAALLKRATGRLIHPAMIEDKLDQAKEAGKAEAARDLVRLTNNYDSIVADVKLFEQASGLSIHNKTGWLSNAARIGAAVNIVLKNSDKVDWHLKSIKRAKSEMEKTIADIDLILKSYPEIPEEQVKK